MFLFIMLYSAATGFAVHSLKLQNGNFGITPCVSHYEETEIFRGAEHQIKMDASISIVLYLLLTFLVNYGEAVIAYKSSLLLVPPLITHISHSRFAQQFVSFVLVGIERFSPLSLGFYVVALFSVRLLVHLKCIEHWISRFRPLLCPTLFQCLLCTLYQRSYNQDYCVPYFPSDYKDLILLLFSPHPAIHTQPWYSQPEVNISSSLSATLVGTGHVFFY